MEPIELRLSFCENTLRGESPTGIMDDLEDAAAAISHELSFSKSRDKEFLLKILGVCRAMLDKGQNSIGPGISGYTKVYGLLCLVADALRKEVGEERQVRFSFVSFGFCKALINLAIENMNGYQSKLDKNTSTAVDAVEHMFDICSTLHIMYTIYGRPSSFLNPRDFRIYEPKNISHALRYFSTILLDQITSVEDLQRKLEEPSTDSQLTKEAVIIHASQLIKELAEGRTVQEALSGFNEKVNVTSELHKSNLFDREIDKICQEGKLHG